MGAPRWPPTPPSFGPPRRSRGGPLSTWGPRHGPQSPIVRTAPAKPWRSSIYMGAPTWPPIPHRSDRPGKAVAVLYLHGGPDMAPNPPSLGPPRQSRGGPLFKAHVRLLRAGGGALAS